MRRLLIIISSAGISISSRAQGPGLGNSASNYFVAASSNVRVRNNAIKRNETVNVLAADTNRHITWQPLSFADSWSLTGNGSTNPSVNFLGTTDNQPLMLRQNNLYAGRFEYALRNYFIGNQAGRNTAATHNIAIGDSALFTNSSGFYNIAIGRSAMLRGAKYFANVAIGDSTLCHLGEGDDGGSNLYSSQNTAVGSKALYHNQRGYNNTAIGYKAGYNMQLGSRNTVLGAYAMHALGSSEAYESVAIGYHALDSVFRSSNTAVGSYTMARIKSGEENVAIGHSAMRDADSGRRNTAVGFSAMRNNPRGNFNTAIGANAELGGSVKLTYATAIGADASVTKSHSLVLGRITAEGTQVGIGTTAPAHALDIQTNSQPLGKTQLRLHESDNDYVRMRFTNTNTTNSFWELDALPSTTNANARLNFFYSSLFNSVLTLRGDGNAVLIGTLTQSSDARLKKNIHPLSASLQKLLQVTGYEYQWRDENRDPLPQYGVLGQEVEKLFPALVARDDKGYLSVNYSGLVPVLITAVKEQQQLIERLEKRLSALEQVKR